MRLPLTGLITVLLSAAALYHTGNGDPAVTFVAGLAVIACFFHNRVKIPQALLLPLMLPPLLVFLYNPAQLPEGSRFVGPGSYHVALYVGLLMVMILLRDNNEDGKILVGGFAVATMIACGMRSEDERTYAILVGAQAVALALYYRELRAPIARRTWFPMLLAFLPLTGVAWGIAMSLRWSESQLNDWVDLFEPITPLSVSFSNRSKLSAMLTNAGSESVALRIFSDKPPNYIVARAYDSFTKGAWESKSERPRPLPRISPQIEELPTFRINEGQPERVDRIELAHPSGGQLVLPRDTLAVAMETDQLKRDDSTAVIHSATRFRGSYHVQRGRAEPLEASGLKYLDLPEDLPAIVPELAETIAGHLPDPRDKAGAIERYMQENFEYGFGYPFKDDRSPLEEFLTRRPPAHCEFFATAMVTMLRSQQVPARYVVGFIVDPADTNPLGGYTMVRGRHAHAWVEVYLDGQWRTFDPTPPASRVQPRPAWRRWLSRAVDLLMLGFHRLRAFFQLSPLEMVKAVWSSVKGVLQYLAARPAALVVVMLGLVAIHLLRQRFGFFKRPRPPAGEVDDTRLGELLARFERAARRHGFERPPHFTLLEWAPSLSELPGAREFLERYCRARYARASEELDALVEALEALKPAARQRSSRAS